MDQFEFQPGASPASYAARWPMEFREYTDRPKGVGFGGWKGPFFDVDFDARGMIRSVNFATMD